MSTSGGGGLCTASPASGSTTGRSACASDGSVGDCGGIWRGWVYRAEGCTGAAVWAGAMAIADASGQAGCGYAMADVEGENGSTAVDGPGCGSYDAADGCCWCAR